MNWFNESQKPVYPFLSHDSTVAIGEASASFVLSNQCTQSYAQIVGYAYGFARAKIDELSNKMFEKLPDIINDALIRADI